MTTSPSFRTVLGRVARGAPALLAAALLLLEAGCESRPPLVRVKLPEFQEGVTSKDEVLRKLGTPTLRFRSAGGDLLLRFWSGESEASIQGRLVGWRAQDAGVVRAASASFIFGEDGILKQQLASTAVLTIEGGNQGVHVGPQLDAEVMGKWQRGRTPMNQILAQLGEPAAQLLSFDGALVLVWMRMDFVQFLKAGVHSEFVAARFSESGTVEEFGLMGRNQAFAAFP
jgi:hypothetical protein